LAESRLSPRAGISQKRTLVAGTCGQIRPKDVLTYQT